ncbi:hypothetical protein SAMN06264365_1173 [Actinoplanes regularis]|uniref:Uncharacterized protein n=1 Tax=Actinoplanes regularis TaxID=52697 RepID=A0A239EZY8_9ACTN|nr:hypothetical protein SAMN06264365_1173 [Actinoplanes regularis]
MPLRPNEETAARRGWPVSGQGRRSVEQPDRAGRPVDRLGRLVDVEGRRQLGVPQRLHHFDHRGDTGRGLGVADVRLERAEPQRFAGTVPPVRVDQRPGLDRVAEGGAGAVRVDRVDLVGGETRVGQRGPDHLALRRPAGGGEPVGGAVLVDGAAPHHREHPVAVAPRVGEPFQHDHAGAFGEAGAVGGLRERLAPAVRRQPLQQLQLEERGGRAHHGDPTGQRERAVALPQRLSGEVQRDQRGRAGRVDRDGRALQPEGVGDPSGDDGAGAPGAQERCHSLRDVGQRRHVVGVVHQPGEHSGRGAAQRRRIDTGVLQRLPRHLEGEPVLRVHGPRLPRRDAEEQRVEAGHVVQEAAAAAAQGTTVRVDVPAAVVREAGDGVAAVDHQLPQSVRVGHPARRPAGHADDRDRLARPSLHLGQTLPGLVQVGGDLLEEMPQFVLVAH